MPLRLALPTTATPRAAAASTRATIASTVGALDEAAAAGRGWVSGARRSVGFGWSGSVLLPGAATWFHATTVPSL